MKNLKIKTFQKYIIIKYQEMKSGTVEMPGSCKWKLNGWHILNKIKLKTIMLVFNLIMFSWWLFRLKIRAKIKYCQGIIFKWNLYINNYFKDEDINLANSKTQNIIVIENKNNETKKQNNSLNKIIPHVSVTQLRNVDKRFQDID